MPGNKKTNKTKLWRTFFPSICTCVYMYVLCSMAMSVLYDAPHPLPWDQRVNYPIWLSRSSSNCYTRGFSVKRRFLSH